MKLCFIAAIALSGCGLLDDGPEGSDLPGPEDPECPKPGTHAEILYPLDGAMNVPQPVPIQMRITIPNTHDGPGAELLNRSGVHVDGHIDATCSMPPNPDNIQIQCYNDLGPDSSYTFRIWVTCYDSTGSHDLATSTFRTAP